jgi:hypothetical protein
VSVTWMVEHIPDEKNVYMRVHKSLCPDGQIRPNVFRDHMGSMSVDWERYSRPEDTRNRGAIPDDNGVISLNSGSVRTDTPLTVSHQPLPENRAHSEICGLSAMAREDQNETRLKLARLSVVEIPLPPV